MAVNYEAGFHLVKCLSSVFADGQGRVEIAMTAESVSFMMR